VDFAAALAARRSCRDYRPDPIPEPTLRRVLGAARRGPTAGNAWALDLIVIDEPAEYWRLTLPAGPVRDGFRWQGLLAAPVLVIPVIDPSAYPDRYAEMDKIATRLGDKERWVVPYWWIDAGAAVMAVLLAATDAGLGSLLFGQFAHEAVLAARFGIPAGRQAVGTIALGWPTAEPGTAGRSAGRRRPPLDDIVHLNGW
jgi:nitroreductase